MTDVRRVLECRGRACGLRMPAPGRRGIALLLVLGVLAAVTILTAGALTSQQNAPTMGQNAAAEVQAKWSAESAAEIAAAVLETEFDYSGSNAQMMTDFLVSQGLADVSVTNLAGEPPSAQDRELLLTASATVDGITREIRKRLSVTPSVPAAEAADAYYREFGLVATDALVIEPDASVRTWGLSPEAVSTKPVAIGAFTGAGAKVCIDPGADLKQTALFVGANADAALSNKTGSDNMTAMGTKLPYTLPVAVEPVPSAFAGLPEAVSHDIALFNSSQSATLPTGGKYKRLFLQGGSVLTLNASNGTHYSFDSVLMTTNSAIVVQGAVVIEFRNQLKVLDGSAIALADGSSGAAIFVTDDVLVENAGIGVPLAVARAGDRSPASLTVYSRPDRVRVFARSSGGGNPKFELKDNSLVAAVVHAPESDFMVDKSALVGRVTGKQVHLGSSALLCYDPRLDNRVGFTNTRGPLYGANTTALPAVSSVLTSFSTASGAKVLAAALAGITVTPTLSLVTGLVEDVEGTGGTALTPRTNRVVQTARVEDDEDDDNDMIPDDEEEDD